MASQEHSEASSTSKEKHLLPALEATTSIPITDQPASDEIYKSIKIPLKVGLDTELAITNADISADDNELYKTQDDLDIETTIKIPKNTRNSMYKTIVPEHTSASDDSKDLCKIDTSRPINAIALPLYQSKQARSVDGGLQYRCTIQSKRHRFKLRGLLLPFIAIIVFIAGTLGALYYSGIRFESSTVTTVKPPVATTLVTSTPISKTLSVQGSLIAASQGYTDGIQQTAYVDTQQHIQLLSSTNGQTWQQTDLTRLTAAPVANGTGLTSYHWDKGGKQQIAYLDASGHIHLMSSGSEGQWQVIDLTQRASAPLSGGTTLIGYQWRQTGSQQILFLDQAQHIQELVCTDGTNWHATDITDITSTVVPNGSALAAFIWTQTEEEQIVYVDANRHVIDLSTTAAGNWQSIDLSKTYHAPLANGNVIAGYEWSVDGSMHIDYIDNRNHIQEVSDSLQGQWTLSDVTATTNSPVTNGQALAGFDWIQGGARILLYIDNNKHIQELSQLPQENWNGVDLTHLTSSALANGVGLIGYTWAVNGSQQVVFVDAAQHLVALSDIANGTWRKVNW